MASSITPEQARAELERRRLAKAGASSPAASTGDITAMPEMSATPDSTTPSEVLPRQPQPSGITAEQARAELERRRSQKAMEGNDNGLLGILGDPANLAQAYGGMVLATTTGGGIGGPTARKWIADAAMAAPGVIGDILDDAKRAVMMPGRALSGELPMTDANGNISQEAINEAANFSMFASPASVARGTFGNAVGAVADDVAGAAAKGARIVPEGVQVAHAADRIGVKLPRTMTSDKNLVQATGEGLKNYPLVGGAMVHAATRAKEQMGDAARDIQRGFGLADTAGAGAGVRSGLADFSKNVLKKKVDDAYSAVDQHVTQNVVTKLTRTRQIASNILAERTNARMSGNSGAVGMVQRALAEPDGLNYTGIKKLRTSVGELLEDPQKLANSRMSQDELKAIYRGLSDDLRLSVARGGGKKAEMAFEEANSLAAQVAKEREAFDRLIGKNASDENIFSKIEAMAGSSGRADVANLFRLRGALSKESWGDISATMLSRIGRDKEGNFSPDRFITGYGGLSKSGKDILFRTPENKGLTEALDDLAAVSSRFKDVAGKHGNPSGTTKNMNLAMMGGALLAFAADPMTTVAGVVGGNIMAKVMSNPMSARKLAHWAKSYEQAAVKPSRGANQILAQQAKALASTIATLEGTPELAEQLTPVLSRLSHQPASPYDEHDGRNDKQGRVSRDARQPLPMGL